MFNFFQKIVGNKCTKTLERFILYTRQLQFMQKPDYQYLRNLLLNELAEHGYSNDLQFDWLNTPVKNEKPKTNIEKVIKERNTRREMLTESKMLGKIGVTNVRVGQIQWI